MSNAKGYQIQYAMNKKFTKNKKIVKTNKHSIQIKKLIDIVIELLDARIPIASRNPDIEEITKGKKKYTKWSKVKSIKCK